MNVSAAPCYFLSDDFSEELLSAHESELDRMKGFYQDNLEVFQMIRKRDKLWHQQLDLDVRGGGSLISHKCFLLLLFSPFYHLLFCAILLNEISKE